MTGDDRVGQDKGWQSSGGRQKKIAVKKAWRERVEARVGSLWSHRKSHILSFVHFLQLLSFEASNCICSEGKRTKTVPKENILFLAASRTVSYTHLTLPTRRTV